MPNDTQMAPAKSSDAEAAPLDVLTKAVGPATAPDEDAGTDTQSQPSDQTQSSSVTPDDEKSPKPSDEKDLLSVVRDAVEGNKDPETPADKKADTEGEGEDAPSASGKSDAQKKADAPAGDAEDEITPEELAEYKPKVRKRIEGLLSERRELREQAATLREPAEQYQKITGYMETYGLTAEDVATAFSLTAMFKHEPERAREELMKRVEMLDGVIGNKLSDDLKKKVDDGFLDEETAREISRSRAAAQREREKREFVEQRTEQEQQRQVAAATQTAVQTAVREWQQSKMQADPEFAQKAELLETQVKAMVAQYGQPKTREQALQMADIAYERVNAMVSKFKPSAPVQQPQAKRVVQSRHVSGNPRPAPSNPLEVVKAAIQTAK